MTAVETGGKNQFKAASIPWYRDLRVLRVLFQVGFLAVVILVMTFILYNLDKNLEAENQEFNFEVYKRPFGPAISEGISATSEWKWVTEGNEFETRIWIVWGTLLGISALSGVSQYRAKKQPVIPLVIIAFLFVAIVIFPPSSLANELAPYLAPKTVARALITGFYNTLKVVLLCMVASTLVGILFGIGLLSRNFLLRSIATVYVETFRNTPLLVQLYFTYAILSLILPEPRNSKFSQDLPFLPDDLFIINKRGFYFASPQPQDTAWMLALAIFIGLLIAYFVWQWRLTVQEQTGTPTYTFWFVTPIIMGSIILGWIIAAVAADEGRVFITNYPELVRTNIQGGYTLTLFFVALFIGLTLYTSAFIADIVRAGIQAVPPGQIEAARSQGLSNSQLLTLVILPQALRLIIPPLGNQYVNMGKNSSLGVAVSYSETYLIARLANNELGQAIPLFLGLMLIYLSLSLSLSLFANFLNRFAQIRTR